MIPNKSLRLIIAHRLDCIKRRRCPHAAATIFATLPRPWPCSAKQSRKSSPSSHALSNPSCPRAPTCLIPSGANGVWEMCLMADCQQRPGDVASRHSVTQVPKTRNPAIFLIASACTGALCARTPEMSQRAHRPWSAAAASFTHARPCHAPMHATIHIRCLIRLDATRLQRPLSFPTRSQTRLSRFAQAPNSSHMISS